MKFVQLAPEDALQRILAIESLGDAMNAILEMGPLPHAEFARLNNAVIKKHFPDGVEQKTYHECVRRDLENFGGPEETHLIVCSTCLEDVPVDEDNPTSEFVLLDKNPLPFEGLECEVCGQ